MEKLGSPAEAQAQDDLEIVSIGALYRGHWEKKYWSSSRAKDRYPYPVGYRAVRDHAGTRCQMEIREGPKGPLFMVKLADEESCSGLTPDLAWKSFQKKNSPKAINWNGRRLSSNIDGSELFGFRNKVVQRLLRELVADANSASPNETKQALQLHENVQNQYRSSDTKLLVYFRKSKRNGKRSVKCKPEERITKRMHKEGCMSNDIEKSDLLGGSQKGALPKITLHWPIKHHNYYASLAKTSDVLDILKDCMINVALYIFILSLKEAEIGTQI